MDLIITAFNSSFDLSASAELDDKTLDISSDAIINLTTTISKDMLRNTFFYRTDDAILADASFVYYYVDSAAFTNALTVLNPKNGTILSSIDGAYKAGDNVSKDFLRDLAKQLFGTHLGVDLFTNEDAVVTNINAKCDDVATAVMSKLTDVDVSSATFTDASLNNLKYLKDDTSVTNISRELLVQMYTAAPSRFATHATNIYTGHGNTLDGYYEIPFEDGDIISYKVTVNPATGQLAEIPTGVASLTSRSYKVNLNVGSGIVLPTYTVKVATNVLGESVFSIQKPGETDYYLQPDISFGAGTNIVFDVSDPTMADISLVFGTTVDNSSSIVNSFVTRSSGTITLDICSGYTGETIKYFEDSSTGMGYNKYLTSNTLNTIFNGVTQPSFYWDFRTTTPETDGTDTYVSDIMDVSDTNLKAVAKGSLSFNSLNGPTFNSTDYIQIDPFTFGGKCSVEVYYYVTSFTIWQRILCFTNSTSLLSDRYIIASSFGDTEKFGVSIQNGNGVYGDYGATTTSLNTWYQAVVTIDETGNLEAYVNKVDQGYNTTITLPKQERIYNLVGAANNVSTQGLNGQIGFVRIWQDHVLTTSEISALYDKRDDPYGSGNSSLVYTVTVSGSPQVFYMDTSANPDLSFASGETYVFDQSDPSNEDNRIVLSTVNDSSANLIDYQTAVGTPGQPGAYTTFTASGETVYYMSYQSSSMGYQ